MADMNLTAARSGLTPVQFDSDLFVSYIRTNKFSRYFGTTENSMIQLKETLTKQPGDTINFSLLHRLTGAGQTSGILEGNEENLDLRSMKVTVAPIRHGVAVNSWDAKRSVVDIRAASRVALKNWLAEKLRNDIIGALGSINGVAYATATATQRSAWLVANSDRVLFGNAKANNTSNHLTSLQNIDPVNDTLTYGVVSLMKRMAKLASPSIRPIVVEEDGTETYVMFVPSLPFRDLKASLATLYSQADVRGPKNALWADGDLHYDGVIIREVPEIPVLSGAGNAGIDVAPVYLCGAQAIGIAFAQKSTTSVNVRDYGWASGCAVSEIRGVAKLTFGTDGTVDTTTLKDHGLVTGYMAAVADA